MPGAVICVRHAPCGSTPSFPMSILITFVLLRIILFCLFVYFPTFVCVHVCMHVCMYVLYCKKEIRLDWLSSSSGDASRSFASKTPLFSGILLATKDPIRRVLKFQIASVTSLSDPGQQAPGGYFNSMFANPSIIWTTNTFGYFTLT